METATNKVFCRLIIPQGAGAGQKHSITYVRLFVFRICRRPLEPVMNYVVRIIRMISPLARIKIEDIRAFQYVTLPARDENGFFTSRCELETVEKVHNTL